jgi:hypothetical protein
VYYNYVTTDIVCYTVADFYDAVAKALNAISTVTYVVMTPSGLNVTTTTAFIFGYLVISLVQGFQNFQAYTTVNRGLDMTLTVRSPFSLYYNTSGLPLPTTATTVTAPVIGAVLAQLFHPSTVTATPSGTTAVAVCTPPYDVDLSRSTGGRPNSEVGSLLPIAPITLLLSGVFCDVLVTPLSIGVTFAVPTQDSGVLDPC